MEPSPARPTVGGRAGAVGVFVLGTAVCFVALPLIVDVFTEHPPGALVVLALLQLLGAALIVAWWLRRRGLGREEVGARRGPWLRDVLVGAATVPPRLLLELGVLVPLAGGASNEGVQEVLRNAAGGTGALVATLVLAVVGGGIAEELYFRGFLVGAVPHAFVDRRRARWVAAVVSVVLFAALHLPSTAPDVVSIVVAALTYTGLYLATGRLAAPMVAHSLWNLTVVFAVLAVYG